MKFPMLHILILGLTASSYQACDGSKGSDRIHSDTLEKDPNAGDGSKGGGKEPGDLPADKNAEFISKLEGTWVTECVPLVPGPGAKINKATFDTKQFIHETTEFSDNECSVPERVIVTTTSYKIGLKTPQPSFEETYEFDKIHISGQLTPKVQTLVDEYNDISLLEYTDWKLDEAKEFSGRRATPESAPEIAAGSPIYHLVGIRDGFLVFGDTAGLPESSTPASRPKTLSTSLVYTKK